MGAVADAALETLLLPIDEGRIAWPAGPVLFLRARCGAALQRQPRPGLLCEQTYRPEADALRAAGFTLRSAEPGPFALILLLPPRQRSEARALMARAVTLLAPGGRIVAAVSNLDGARASEADLAQLTGEVETLSKHKCRVFWTSPSVAMPAQQALQQQWLALDAVQRIDDERFLSRPGLFAWDRIDPASQLLAQQLPEDLKGRAADLGAGFGYLSVELLQRCPAITALDLFEAEQRALDLAQQNLLPYAGKVQLGFHWHDVTAGLPRSYDVIVTNPPFHTRQGADDPDIGRRFIVAAAAALNPGGSLWLVANRHLPYEQVLDASFGRVRVVTQQQGFKIIEAMRLPATTPLRRRGIAG